MIRIRDAKIEDVSWILGELRSFDKFFGLKKNSFVPADDAAAMEVISRIVDTQPFFIAELAESGDHHGAAEPQQIGLIAGVLAPHIYNNALIVLTELFWWVTPGFRTSSAASRLLAHFMEYGKQYSDMIVITMLENTPLDADALEKRGFHLHERSFLMEV